MNVKKIMHRSAGATPAANGCVDDFDHFGRHDASVWASEMRRHAGDALTGNTNHTLCDAIGIKYGDGC
jgi:hypothetical protein